MSGPIRDFLETDMRIQSIPSGPFLGASLLAIVAAATVASEPAVLEPAVLEPTRSAPVVRTARPGAATPISQALTGALDTCDAARLRADIEWIAADERRGRDTPSTGLEETARYLSARLEELGFEHGARDGFLYSYPLGWRQLDEGASSLTVRSDEHDAEGGLRLTFASDYYLRKLSDLADGKTSGEVVSVGEGSRSDYKRVDLEGKWALCFDDGGSTRQATSRAEDGGAIGILFTPGPDYDREPYAERYSGVANYAAAGSLGKTAPGPQEARESREFPSLFLTREAATRAFGSSGRELSLRSTPPGTELSVEFTEERRLTYPGGYRLFENVCGLWPGSDPELRNEVLIVSAHYDHIGARGDEINNGADDNGSGTAALLAIANALKTYGPMRRSVLLLWVSGEEKGLLGSRAWTERPWLPEGMFPVANVNVDMIGRNDPEKLLITPSRSLRDEYNGIVKLAERFAGEEGFDELGSADRYWRRSDHMNFADNLGLPVAFLFADVHADYHKPSDTADKIDYDKVRRGVRLILRILDGLQEDSLNLRRQKTPGATEFREKVLRGTTLADLEQLTWALEGHRLTYGSFPESLDALVGTVLVESRIPLDPWGRDYVFEGGTVKSFGADGAPGGDGLDADIMIAQ